MKTFILTTCLSTILLANDSYLGTNGGNIYPQKTTEIQMIKEDISIELEKYGGQVDCKFWFINRGEDDSVYVGFPDVEINPASSTLPAKNFRAWVNGKQVNVKQDSLTEVYEREDTVKSSWYYWKVHFKKNDTTFIENKYYGLWGGSYCEKAFKYIIGTGNKWGGPIKSGRVTFHHDNLLSNLFIGKEVGRDSNDLIPKYYEDSTVYEFSNYVPREDETLEIWFSSYWGNLKNTDCPGFYIPVDSLKNKGEIINELFARNGHVFNSAKLQKKYENKPWYNPKRELKLNDLPFEVQFYISNLKKNNRSK